MDLHDDDQTEMTKWWFNNNLDKIILDYEQVLFTNAFVWGYENNLGGCPYERDENYNNQFVLKKTKICPFFIQTPAKYWFCYNYLYGI